MRRNEALICGMTQMSPENIMLSERSQTQKAIHCMIPLIRNGSE